MRNKNLKSAGFTLIELLIVIIIIGILAAIAFVAYSGSQNKAHKADAQSTLAEVKNKMGEYNADHSSYPASMTDVENWLGGSEGGSNTALVNTLTSAGSSYTYTPTPSGCGDTVASGGAVTAGATACSGFSLTAKATLWNDVSPANDITVTN